MAKNTSSSAFRKIDVDQYNEDNFKDDDNDQMSAGIGPDENEIQNLLNQYPFLMLFTYLFSCFSLFPRDFP